MTDPDDPSLGAHGEHGEHGEHGDSVPRAEHGDSVPSGEHGDVPRAEQGDVPRGEHGDVPRAEHGDSVPRGEHGDSVARAEHGDVPRAEHGDSVPRSEHGDSVPSGEQGDVPRGEHGDVPRAEQNPVQRVDALDADEPAVFPPTLREVLLRPRWLALLLLCLVVAGIFAWLGQWQLSRAIDTDPLPPGATEEVLPLAEVTAPGEYLPEPLVGQRVEATGRWVAGDFLIVTSRFNDGEEGYWVTGQLRLDGTEARASVAVAIGWAATLEEARAGADQFEADAAGDDGPVTVVGRLISDEGPLPPPRGADPQTMTRMSPAAHLSQWHDVEGLDVYRPYLAAETSPAPLADIHSPAPDEGSGINWLNIFYAIEWAIFAGFAFYLWYRLARDAWEKEVEDLEDAVTAGSGPAGDAASGG